MANGDGGGRVTDRVLMGTNSCRKFSEHMEQTLVWSVLLK